MPREPGHRPRPGPDGGADSRPPEAELERAAEGERSASPPPPAPPARVESAAGGGRWARRTPRLPPVPAHPPPGPRPPVPTTAAPPVPPMPARPPARPDAPLPPGIGRLPPGAEAEVDPAQLQILRLIERGDITAAEGARLLAALDTAPARHLQPAAWLRVRLTDTRSQRLNLAVNVPVKLSEAAARAGLKLGRVLGQPEAAGDRLEPARLLDAIRHGDRGTIFLHEDPTTGERLEIRLD